MLPDKFHGTFPNARVHAAVGLAATRLVGQSASAFFLIPRQQSICLPLTDFQQGSCIHYSPSANQYFT
jgi:hypothetical protein